MRIQRNGIEVTLSDVPKSLRLARITKTEPSKRGAVIARFKEYLEALIHDERYEEAGRLHERLQEFKRSCSS